MSDACPLPDAAPAEPTPAGRILLEELRRFHFGAPGAAGALPPAGLLPAALARFRGRAVRGGWPLLADPAAAGEALARPAAEWLAAEPATTGSRALADNLARVEIALGAADRAGGARPARAALASALAEVATELELPPGERAAWDEAAAALVAAAGESAMLVPLSPEAPRVLADLAARRRLARARAAFAAEAQELAGTAEALLEADRARRPDGETAGARAERLGALASRLLDAERLSGVVAHRRAGAPFAEERRLGLEVARARLAAFGREPGEPVWIVAEAGAGEPPRAGARTAGDPFAAAAERFDAAAAEVAELVRAVRRVRLESAEAYEPERHGPGLERLDWRAFSREELALVPPVLVRVAERDLLSGALASLVRLLLSGRPVQVLVARDFESEEQVGWRLEPAWLGVGLREVFVHQGSIARPGALAAGFSRALAGTRSGLHVLDAPVAPVDGVDPWLAASARVAGRATPLFRYDPEAGESAARRFRFDDNPEPAADWPSEAGGADAPPAPFTYADAALLDPGWRAHFAVAAQESEDLVPVADWLALEPEETVRRLPCVAAVDGDGGTRRLVVSRALALATRDRLSFWRTLEELAGVRNEHVEEAAARARREAEAVAAAERAAAAARHAAELERVAADADAAAVERLVSALFEVEPEGGAAPAARARPARAEGGPVASGTGAAAESKAAPAPAPAAAPAPAVGAAEEAWVDTPMCTSCDECVRKYPAIFVYNGDKQAIVKNARGGTFRDLVLAAEKCTAKVIHPGAPWNPSEPDLAAWVERAKPFG